MSDIFTLRPLGLAFDGTDGILPAETAESLNEASLILARAREQAAAIIADAEAARDEERRLGYAAGLAEAQAQSAAWLHDARQDLERRLDAMQTELADVVVQSVKRIVHSFDDRHIALETVRSALASLRSEKRLQLFVAPSAEVAVREALPAFKADYPEIELIDVIADPALSTPDVRLESELGVVTSILDDTLAQLGRLLRGV
jgi:type III secretion protein L